MKRRQLILLLGGGSAAATSVGTGAFSSVSADREVSVNVSKDANAYLGITVDDETDAVQVRNQFADDLDLTVALESADGGVDELEVSGSIAFRDETVDGGVEVDDESDDDALGPGEAAHVSVAFDEAGDVAFTLSFEGEAGGASVDKSREFTLRPDDVTDRVTKVKFLGSNGSSGNGNSDKVRILTGESNGNSGVNGVVSAKLYCEDDGGTVRSNDEFRDVPVNTNLGVSDFDDGGLDGSIVGIEIEGISGIFVRPDTPGNGSGNTVSKDDTETDPFDG